jgi:hypothetical protein
MAARPLEVVSLTDLDQVYGAYPRREWEGKVMVFMAGECAKSVSYGSKIRMRREADDVRDGGHGATEFEVVVTEMPVMRLPAGATVVAITDRRPGMRFGKDGVMTQVAAWLVDESE